ncbi:MAG: ATP synthase F1 subunit epsilon [Holdemanella sp.]|nr:ATP synthase F1 subunit epsilon [Holdemanella sp.]
MKTFHAQLYACDRVFYEGELESLIFPNEKGLYGIWANHINMISAVVPGILTYRIPGKEDEVALISSGMIKIEDNTVVILAETIEHPDEIDERRAIEAADKAKEVLLQKKGMVEYAQLELSMLRAIKRLKSKGKKE